MKVLLLSANTFSEPYPVYPLGLDYVAGAISDKYQVEIIDMNDIKEIDALGELIKKGDADVIGISLRNVDNTDYQDTKNFIEHYKKIVDCIRDNSNALIVLGGSAFAIFPGEIMDELNADYGIIGEGERFRQFLDAYESNKNLLDIPGIIGKGSQYSIIRSDNNVFKREFDPSCSHVRYYLDKGGMLNLQSKRGCSYKCIYCTYPHIEGSKLRLIPSDEVARTARMLQDAGAKYVFFTDSAFNCNYSHSLEVAEELMKKGVTIPWGGFFAPTKPPDDYYMILADAGLTHIEFGTEALSEKMLSSYRKPFKVDEVFKSHDKAVKSGINVSHYFLFGGPGESNDTIAETLLNVNKLEKSVFFFFCGIRIYPHTYLYDIALKENLISPVDNLLYPVFYESPLISTGEIINRISDYANDRSNWIIGSGGKKTTRILNRMYRRGYTGPLWEYLIQ